MGLLLLFFFVSICFSFLCSIWEAVILSVTPSYVNRKVQDGSPIGETLQAYKKDIDRPLSAVLTLNTIAHTVGAIGVGAQAGEVYGSNSIDLGFASLTYESIIASVMTLAILILSEIIPKTIGANMWRQLAPFTVKSLRILLFVLWPFVWLSQRITKTLKKDKDRSVLSRADFAAMTVVGEESGALDQSESAIIQNLLRLEKLTVRDIMTPRTVLLMADEQQTTRQYFDQHHPIPVSRIPVYNESPHMVTGMILKDDLLLELAEDHDEKKLTEIRRPIIFVKDSDPLPTLLDTLVVKREHIAMVADDFGSIVGIVSMEDLFETILGLEIMDESDAVEDMQRLARKNWKERAKKLGIIEDEN